MNAIDYIPVADEQVSENLYYSLKREAVIYELKEKLNELINDE